MVSEVVEQANFREGLKNSINCHSMENGSDTPDFILAEYLVDCLNAFDKATKKRAEWYATDKLTASEAVYGFAGWLTTRAEKTVMSASDDAAPIAELVDEFCKKHSLTDPREGWGGNKEANNAS